MKKHNNQGQMKIEMVLITVILIGLAYTLKTKLFDPDPNTFYRFVSEPWKSIKVMMESGVWMTDATKGRENHPNQFKRMWSEKGKNLGEP